ncbi:BMP family lipoprotein [Gracilibacillus dipsosauri]|uniref:BMP family lipoprotein n=1 Tax=Gracilibacillus dipsosauri TaxID=178340 RepID=UPI00240A5257
MLKKRILILFALMLTLGLVLAACGSSDDEEKEKEEDTTTETENGSETEEGTEEEGNEEASAGDFTAGLVTDVGGVDDKSFNQSAWEGMEAWGSENGLSQGNGYDYAQSSAAEDYLPNITSFVRNDYNLVFGIGFLLKDDIETAAKQYPETNFALVDDVVEAPNATSITFKEHQGSFLVGVAAALKTESDKIGFVGGVDSPLINKFESGFIAGAKSVNPDIEIQVEYAESFDDAGKGKIIASTMYNDGIDVIYHAAGGAGNGVFSEAKAIKENDPDRQIWVIGVDRDQHEEGQVGDHNVTLTSMVKRVDVAVKDVLNRAQAGDFPGGELLEYGLEEEGITYSTANADAMTDDIISEVEAWKEKILNGEVDVPQTREETEAFVNGL